jgi:hypothetical protein
MYCFADSFIHSVNTFFDPSNMFSGAGSDLSVLTAAGGILILFALGVSGGSLTESILAAVRKWHGGIDDQFSAIDRADGMTATVAEVSGNYCREGSLRFTRRSSENAPSGVKKRFYIVVAATLLLGSVFISCNKDDDKKPSGSEVMQMTVATSGNTSFSMNGTGTAIVEWGDGSINDTKSLIPDVEAGSTKFDHNYSGAGTFTIKIYGENVAALNCCGYELTGLDVSRNTVLMYLDCGGSQLTTLDVSNNKALKLLSCGVCELTDLDVSKNTALTWLECGGNQLTDLDVSKNTALTELQCYANRLTKLDVSKNTALTWLNCVDNQLTDLDVSKNHALTYLLCSENRLTDLDASKNTALIEFSCFDNRLTNLDVSANRALAVLGCQRNQLSTLHVSNAGALEILFCDGNQLTALDASTNTALKTILCQNNQFSANALNALFGTLHSNNVSGGKFISIKGNDGTGSCDQSIAANKGWIVDVTD